MYSSLKTEEDKHLSEVTATEVKRQTSSANVCNCSQMKCSDNTSNSSIGSDYQQMGPKCGSNGLKCFQLKCNSYENRSNVRRIEHSDYSINCFDAYNHWIANGVQPSVWPTVASAEAVDAIPMSYFDPLSVDYENQFVSCNQTNDLLAIIETKINESKEEVIKAIERSEDKSNEYLKQMGNQLLNEVKKMNSRVDSVAMDVKAVKERVETIGLLGKKSFSDLEEKWSSMQTDSKANDRNFNQCISALMAIDSKMKTFSVESTQLSITPSNSLNRQLSRSQELDSLCEPIAKRLTHELRPILTNCFNDLKKSIVNGVIDMNGNGGQGGQGRSRDENDLMDMESDDAEDRNGNRALDVLMGHMSGTRDKESLRSEALDSLNTGRIIKCFRIGLALSDPEFVCHLCSVFQNSSEKLVKELDKCKDKQKLYIDLLDQLFADGVIDESKRWKMGLIGNLIVRIDMSAQVAKDSVPKRANHWSAVLERVAAFGGKDSEKARLLSISLKFLSEDFY